jgi:hypothetical protein
LVLAAAPTLTLVGLTATAQPDVWFTVIDWSPMRIVPIRDGPVFPATLNRTSPVPLPLCPAVMTIQSEEVVAVQPHPGAARTVVALVEAATGAA